MEQEPQAELPDPNALAYLGCVLHRTSQQKLLAEVQKWAFSINGVGIPKQGWLGKAHHMTCKFNPTQADVQAFAHSFGKTVHLRVTSWAMDEYGIAVVVDPSPQPPFLQPIPHITVAHSHEVSAVYSNTLLADKAKWHQPLTPLELMAFVLGVERNQSITFPSMPDPLAAPSYSL